jgi:probable HAF family extracellular repeat protein
VHAAVWENGTLRDLGPPGRPGGASGINERGQIVGIVSSLDCGRLNVWTRPTPSVDRLALLRHPCAGGNHDVEYHAAINERGQVAATGKQRAYLWENGKRLDLGTLPGGSNSIAVAINDQGQIVGASGTPHHFDPDRAVLWTLRHDT